MQIRKRWPILQLNKINVALFILFVVNSCFDFVLCMRFTIFPIFCGGLFMMFANFPVAFFAFYSFRLWVYVVSECDFLFFISL